MWLEGFLQMMVLHMFLNSTLNNTEIQNVKNDINDGVTKLLYVAPESLAKQDYIDFFKPIRHSF